MTMLPPSDLQLCSNKPVSVDARYEWAIAIQDHEAPFARGRSTLRAHDRVPRPFLFALLRESDPGDRDTCFHSVGLMPYHHDDLLGRCHVSRRTDHVVQKRISASFMQHLCSSSTSFESRDRLRV